MRRWLQTTFLHLLGVVLIITGTPGCAEVAQQATRIIILAVTASAVFVAAQEFQKVRAAELDIQMKQLELEGMKKDGTSTRSRVTVNDEQLKKIQETGKLKVKLADGSETEVRVTVK